MVKIIISDKGRIYEGSCVFRGYHFTVEGATQKQIEKAAYNKLLEDAEIKKDALLAYDVTWN